jgi:hypothetical protein
MLHVTSLEGLTKAVLSPVGLFLEKVKLYLKAQILTLSQVCDMTELSGKSEIKIKT